jgi:hypothetical protein
MERKNYRLLEDSSEPQFANPFDLTKVPLVSFFESLKPLQDIIENVGQISYMAMDFAENLTLKNGMTPDEAAALNLYTLESKPKESSFYWILNKRLRDPKRDGIEPFTSYLRLLFESFKKLEPYDTSVHGQLYRAISANTTFKTDQKIRWWSFSSTSCSLDPLSTFAGGSESPIVFSIRCSRGYDISQYSLYPNEKEILIVPPIQLKVKSTMKIKGVTIVDIEQDDTFPLKYFPLDSKKISTKSQESSQEPKKDEQDLKVSKEKEEQDRVEQSPQKQAPTTEEPRKKLKKESTPKKDQRGENLTPNHDRSYNKDCVVYQIDDPFEKGMECYSQCKFIEAKNHFERSKFPPSFVMIGFMYSGGGKIGPMDEKQMNAWFEKAQKHSNFFHTQFDQFNRNSHLGFCFGKYFEFIEKDKKTAIQYFQQSADKGNPLSQANLGYCYQYGDGVDKDLKKAFQYYQSSSDQGFAIGQANLATCYRDGQGTDKIDETRAIELYELSAKQGYSNAQTHLAFCYQNGKGVDKDLKKATELYQKAADQGEGFAKEMLEKLKSGKAIEKKSLYSKIFG